MQTESTMPISNDRTQDDEREPTIALTRRYYELFNDRRLREAAALVAPHALLEQFPLGGGQRGAEAFLRFAHTWIAAFPDACLDIENIEPRGPSLVDVQLTATGTHVGQLDVGTYQFKPTRARTRLKLRELIEVNDGLIVGATMSFDLNDLIAQLSLIDYEELVTRLARIRQLTDELESVQFDAERRREVVSRLGPELDAARRAVRPHFKR